MYFLLPLLACLALTVWIFYHFLFELPKVDKAKDLAFLKGKVVWITGASSGIGEALAQYLRHNTDTKVILSARSVKSLEAVRDDLVESGVKDVIVLPLDLVALAENFDSAVEKVDFVLKKFGRIDVLIHNGGMSMRGDVVSTKLEVDKQLMQTNYFGAVSLTKAVLPSMLQRKAGHIVAMSSVQGKLPIAFRSSYAAAKHAMHGFFHSLRFEVAEFGIGVTVICPGYVKTNISLNALTADGKTYGKMDATQAGGYEPEYIAGLTYTSVRLGLEEILVADLLARAAVMLYAILPTVLTKQMLKRTKKERAKMQQQN